MKKRIRHILWGVLTCMLVACGGGGGGSSPSTPAQNGNFYLSTYALTFSAANQLSSVPSQVVTISPLGPEVAAISISSTTGGAIPSWLTIATSGSNAIVSVSPATLSLGNNDAVVRISSLNSSGQLLSYKDVTLHVTVAANAWGIYDATALPDAAGSVTLTNGTTSAFLLCNTSGTPTTPCKLTNNTVSSGVLTIDSTAAAGETSSYTLRNVLPDGYPKFVTTVFRTRSISPYNGLGIILNLGDSNGGANGGANGGRMQLFVQDATYANNGLVLWNLDSLLTPQTVASTGTITTTAWHTYQMTVTMSNATTGSVSVYVDGGATPVLNQSFTRLEQATAGSAQNSIVIGEPSTIATGKFDLDWIIWTSGIYTPAQLFGKLPSALTSTGY